MPLIPGIVAGFTGAIGRDREANRREQAAIDKREINLLSLLAKSTDPETQRRAFAAMAGIGQGKGKPSFIRRVLETPEGAATVSDLLQFIQTPTTETRQVPDIESQPGQGPLQNIPVGPAAQTLVDQPGAGIGTGPIGLPPPTQGPPEISAAQGGLGIPPPVPTTGREFEVPRRLFKDEATLAADRFNAEFEAQVAQLKAMGVFSDREIGEIAAQGRLEREFTTSGAPFQQGRFAILPNGRTVRTTFDTQTGQDMYTGPDGNLIPTPPGTEFTSAAALSFGNDREAVSRELFGRPFAGLNSTQQAVVRQFTRSQRVGEGIERAGGEARARGDEQIITAGGVARATGDQQIITAFNTKMTPSQLLQFPEAVAGDTLADVLGDRPFTIQQQADFRGLAELDDQLAQISDLVNAVFPEGQGRVATQISLLVQRATADPDLAALESAIKLSLGRVVQLGGDTGRLGVDDIQRAEASMGSIDAQFIGGDTRESIKARLQVVIDLLATARLRDPTFTPPGGRSDLAVPPPGAVTSAPLNEITFDQVLPRGDRPPQ